MNDGGGCLIATAAFGSEMAPQVQSLREVRDNIILETESGKMPMLTCHTTNGEDDFMMVELH